MDASFLHIANALYALMPLQNIFTLILVVVGLSGLWRGFRGRVDAVVGINSNLPPNERIDEDPYIRPVSAGLAFMVGLLILRFLTSPASTAYSLLSGIQEIVLFILLIASSSGVWNSHGLFPIAANISQERINRIGEILFPNISDHATRLHELFIYGYAVLDLVSLITLYALMFFYGRTVNLVPLLKAANRLVKSISKRIRTI